MSKKPNPKVFLRAAKFVQRSLNDSSVTSCCRALQRTMRLASMADLFDTPEYKLFKKMFCNGRGKYSLWFGETIDSNCCVKVKNQQKRIRALKKAATAAKRLAG
jgi:hypothetical protein